LQVLYTIGHTDVDDQRMMVEMAGGSTLSLVYENLLKEAVPNLTGNSTVVLIVCGGTPPLQSVLTTGSVVSVETLMGFKQKYGQS
jgi:ABC-type methionine transport system permease subunit